MASLRTLLNILARPLVSILGPPANAYKALCTTLKRRQQWPKPLSRRQCPQVPTATTEEHVNNAGYFSRLPCELRLQIYEYVLGGRHINIVHCHNNRRLAHRCQLHDPANPKDSLRIALSQCAEEHWTAPPCNMGPLLRTCRLLHTEAAEVLYTKNSFGVCRITNLAVFVCFSRTIRAERLASISSLTITILNQCGIDAPAKEICWSIKRRRLMRDSLS